jgi:hypothetical protein
VCTIVSVPSPPRRRTGPERITQRIYRKFADGCGSDTVAGGTITLSNMTASNIKMHVNSLFRTIGMHDPISAIDAPADRPEWIIPMDISGKVSG